jgi:hypothetical protein
MCGHLLLGNRAHDHGDVPAEAAETAEEAPEEAAAEEEEEAFVAQGSGLRAVRQLAGGGGGDEAPEEAEEMSGAAPTVNLQDSASQQMMLLLLTSQLQGRAQAEELAQTIAYQVRVRSPSIPAAHVVRVCVASVPRAPPSRRLC